MKFLFWVRYRGFLETILAGYFVRAFRKGLGCLGFRVWGVGVRAWVRLTLEGIWLKKATPSNLSMAPQGRPLNPKP